MPSKKVNIRTDLTLDGASFRRGLARSQRDLKKFRDDANVALRTTAIAAGAAGAAALAIGASYEQSLANVRAVTGRTREELAKTEKQARDLGRTTSESASQVVEAQINLFKAGLDVNEVLGTTEATLRFAGAAMQGMGDASELVVGTLKAFNIATDDSARVANTLYAVTVKTNAGFEDLAEAMKYAGPVASSLKIPLETTVSAIGSLADQNLKGSSAATAMNEALLGLRNPSEEVQKYLGDMSLKTHDLATLIDKLSSSGFDAGDAFEVFGRRGGRAISIWMNQGAEALRKVQTEITGTSAAWDAYTTQQDTTIGAFNRLRSALEDVAITISEKFGDRLKNTLDGAATFINRNTGRISDAMGTVVKAADGAWKATRRFVVYLGEHQGEVEVFATAIGTLTVSLYALATATAAVNAVMALNPWTAVAAAVVGIGSAVYVVIRRLGGWERAWLELKEAALLVFETIRFEFEKFRRMWDVLDLIADNVVGFMRAVAEAVRDNWKALMIGDFTAISTAAFDNFKRDNAAVWNDFQNRHGKAMENALATHKARMAEITEEHRRAVESLDWPFPATKPTARPYEQPRLRMPGPVTELSKPAQETSSAAADAFSPPSYDRPDQEVLYDMFGHLNKVRDQKRSVEDLMLQDTSAFWSAMSDAFDTGWGSILDVEMTGKQRREEIWAAMRRSFIYSTGEELKKVLFSEQAKQKVTEIAESSRTAAKAAGASSRAAIGTAEVAQAAVETSANTTQAASGFFASFSKIPFVGIALALAAIGTMVAALRGMPKFASGGLVGGRPGVDKNLIWASHDEMIMNSAATSANRPVLEAMNAGFRALTPAAPAAGRTEFHLHVPAGSLLVMDDQASLDRVATRLHDAMERGIKRRFHA